MVMRWQVHIVESYTAYYINCKYVVSTKMAADIAAIFCFKSPI